MADVRLTFVQRALFLPEGFQLEDDFLSESDERELLQVIRDLDFGTFEMHGVVARRRVVHYGFGYSFGNRQLKPGPPIPEFLEPLRARSAQLISRSPDALAEALITEYSPGAAIGWHRDAPPFGIVIGISLLSNCRFRFQRGEGGSREALTIDLAPRSVYVLDGPARTEWQHSIPAVKTTRYSITFRTLRSGARLPV